MNRWHVYEYLKQVYMYRGTMPCVAELSSRFKGMDLIEFAEGLYEFDKLLGFIPTYARAEREKVG